MFSGTDKLTGDLGIMYNAVANAYAAPGDGATSTISTSGTAAAATGLVAGSTYLVTATEACHVIFDNASGDATTGDALLVAGVPYFFRLDSDKTRCSAIQSSSPGTLYLTRLGA